MTHMVKPLSDEDMLREIPETSTIQQVPVRQSGVWVLIATILGSSMAFIDGTVVNVALPVLQVDLKATVADVQWVVEAYSLFLGRPHSHGRSLGDHFGRRRIFALVSHSSQWPQCCAVLHRLSPCSSSHERFRALAGHCWFQGAWRSSVLHSKASSVDERLGPGRASRLSPQVIGPVLEVGW